MGLVVGIITYTKNGKRDYDAESLCNHMECKIRTNIHSSVKK